MAAEHRQYLERETLRDGRPVVIRAIRSDDKDALVQGFRRLSDRSVYNRFLGPKRGLSPAELKYLTELDFVGHVALLAVVSENEGEQAVGVGRFIVDGSDATAAEVALTVDDEHQGLGIGTLLLAHLASIGRELGLSRFWAEVRGTNRKMLEVFERCGLPMKRKVDRGVATVQLSL